MSVSTSRILPVMALVATSSAVSFANADGARAFGEMTARLIGQRIAIVYEGRVLLAPVVREPILGGAMIISGDFTSEEVSDLAVMLSVSELPDSVSLISQRKGPVAEPPKKSLLQRLFD